MKVPEIKDLKKDIKLPGVRLPKSLNVINPLLLSDVLFRKDKRTELFLELSLEKRIELLRSVTNSVKRDIMLHVPEEDLAEVLEAMDPDDTTDMLLRIGTLTGLMQITW